MVQRPPVADQCHVLRARDEHIVAKRRDQPKPADGVGLARDRFRQAKRVQCSTSLRRDGATAGLVTGKIEAIDDYNSTNTELAKTHRGREASGAGTNNAHVGVGDRAAVDHACLLGSR